jgi:tetratricopeptide (TPR) repeat protein
MPNVSIRGKYDWGFCGHSTINHDYNLKAIKGDKVVVDNATGLMWHQNGSDDRMEWDKAKEWVRSLNGRGYAGYHDWKLPTLEEAASLLESNKRNDSYIDPIFSNKQGWIWTGDKFEIKGRWDVHFDRFFNCIQSGGVLGGGDWGRIGRHEYVRPVRSVLSKDVEPSYQSGRDTGQVQDKSDARVHYNLGRDYNVLDMHKEAIESYKQAIRIDPDDAEAHYLLGNTYLLLDMNNEALDACKQAIRINPDYAEALTNLGVAYGNLDMHKEAIESFKQAIRIDPDDAEAHNNLGVAYGELGKHEEAIKSYKQEPEHVVNKWTLQIISYSNTKKHLKQAANLAKAIKKMTGYNTFVAKRGKEIVVCAGRFNLKDSSELREAQKGISKLEYEGKRQFASSFPIQIK